MKRYIIILLVLCFTVTISSDSWAKVITSQVIEPSRAHIRYSPEAEALVKTATKSEKEQDWRAASENYQKAIELYSQYLIKAPVLNDNPETSPEIIGTPLRLRNNDLYWGVQHFCGNALRNLPPEGKKVYNEMFGPVAKHAFENAVKGRLDIGNLAQLAEFYALTESGRQALTLLLRWHLERGELFRASGYYRKLKLNHPRDAEVLFERKIVEDIMVGKPSGIEWQTYAGNNTRSKTMINQLAGGSSDGPRLSSAFAWTGYFKVPKHIIKLFLRSYKCQKCGTELEEKDTICQRCGEPKHYDPIPYFPVANNGVIYLPTSSGIYTFELPARPTGGSEPKEGEIPQEIKLKWKVEYEISSTKFPEERVINTATLSSDGKRLYVPLISSFEKHEERLGFLDVKYPFPRRLLFCFDTTTAKALWKSDKVSYSNDGANPCDDIIFPVAPAEEGDLLYVAGIRMPNQVDISEHYIFAMNARNGAVYFKTFISSGILETNLFNNPSREPIASAVTVDRDNIYYCSQMGVITAIDKYTGLVKWLKKYDEYLILPTWPNYTPPRLPLRWVNNPIIYMDNTSFAETVGQILVTSIDSPFFYLLSANTGEELWRWNGDESPLGNIRYLVGVKDGFLVLSGESCLICLNLNKGGKMEWKIEGGRFNGKSAITDDRVYITSDYTLMEIALKTGKLISRNILQGKEEIQPSANLLIVGDLLIRNSIGQMNIYRIANKKETVDSPR